MIASPIEIGVEIYFGRILGICPCFYAVWLGEEPNGI